MKSFYLGIDISKGYADFMIIDSKKQPVAQAFQLDDTFEGHHSVLSLSKHKSPGSGSICPGSSSVPSSALSIQSMKT